MSVQILISAVLKTRQMLRQIWLSEDCPRRGIPGLTSADEENQPYKSPVSRTYMSVGDLTDGTFRQKSSPIILHPIPIIMNSFNSVKLVERMKSDLPVCSVEIKKKL